MAKEQREMVFYMPKLQRVEPEEQKTIRDLSGRVERRCFERACQMLLGASNPAGIEQALQKEFGPEVVRDMLVTYASGDYDLFGRKFEGKVFEAEVVSERVQTEPLRLGGGVVTEGSWWRRCQWRLRETLRKLKCLR